MILRLRWFATTRWRSATRIVQGGCSWMRRAGRDRRWHAEPTAEVREHAPPVADGIKRSDLRAHISRPGTVGRGRSRARGGARAIFYW